MSKKFIGKSMKTGDWIVSDNQIYDEKNKSYYLIPNLFDVGELDFGNRKSLYKFKVEPNSIGVEVGQDYVGNTLFTGDKVEIFFYFIDATNQGKFKDTATVVYDEEKMIYYMRSKNRAFLFAGDSKHLISSIARIGR